MGPVMSSRPVRQTAGSASVNGHSSFPFCKIDLVHWGSELQHLADLDSSAGYLLLSVVSAKGCQHDAVRGKW
jgi:hypothetical protein